MAPYLLSYTMYSRSVLHIHAVLILILLSKVWQGLRWSCSTVWPHQRAWLWIGLRGNCTGSTAIWTRSRWPSLTEICAPRWSLEAWSIHGPSLSTQGRGTLRTNYHIQSLLLAVVQISIRLWDYWNIVKLQPPCISHFCICLDVWRCPLC